MVRTSAIIHLDSLRGNIQAVKGRIGPKREICMPVKADAYGHGALPVAAAALEAGVSCLAVATVQEGQQLRQGGINAPVLLLSQPSPEDIPALADCGLIPFVSDVEFAGTLNAAAAAAGKKLRVHLKIDTGMGRMGCVPAEAAALARYIAGCPALEYAGTATHFAASDSAAAADVEYTSKQIQRFKEAVADIQAAGIDTGIVHAANSGAVLLHPDAWFDMVRPGILLYGYRTAAEKSGAEPLPVRPLMELRTTVSFIKPVKKGETVSYGRIWTAAQDTTVAVLPFGYADGFPRLVSGKWQVLINGKTYPQVGRICMDQCLVDLGPATEVRRRDEAVVFGGSAPDAAALAATIGTIPYEITCNINKRVPREYVDNVRP
jgi:alanine racemase